MNDQLAERIAIALEQIALEMIDAKAPAPAPVYHAPAPTPGPFAPIGTAWLCPQHGTSRIVPAGVSKKTGRPYSAFLVCGEQGCDMKPPMPQSAPARAVPPSAGPQQMP